MLSPLHTRQAMDISDYQALFEAVPTPLLVLSPDEDFKIIAVNKSYLKATLTQRENIIVHKLFDIFPDNPQDPQATGMRNLRASLERVIAFQKTDIMSVQKYDIRKPSGEFETRYWSPLNAPLFNDKHQIIAIIHKVEDVTGYVRLQKKVKEDERLNAKLELKVEHMASEIFNKEKDRLHLYEENTLLQNEIARRELAETRIKLLDLGIENIEDYAVICLDTQGQIKIWNKGAEVIGRYKSEEVIDQPATKLYETHEIESKQPEYELKVALEQGRFENEGWKIRKDGTSFWANMIINPVFDEKNEHIGFVKVIRDLTQCKKAELAVAESEHHYRMLTSSAPVGILHFTAQGHLTYANEQACQMMGLSLEETLGEGWLNAIHPEDKETVVNSWRHAHTSEEPFTLEYRFYQQKNDTTLWVINQIQPEWNEEKHIKSYVHTLTNISQRKQLEESQNTEAKLKEFINTICHEIRNPLNGMMGSTEMLKDLLIQLKTFLKKYNKTLNFEMGHDVEAMIESLTDIYKSLEKSVQHQKIILDDVLTYTKLEHNKLDLKIAPFSPRNVILSAAQILSSEFKRKNIELKLDFPDNGIIVDGDEQRLKQVLVNLLCNALKFTLKGRIQISLMEHFLNENNVELGIHITDTGIGMDKEEISQLFKRFTQFSVSSSSSEPYEVEPALQSTGLGLDVGHKLIEMMGGRIEVKSEKGKGTEINVIVPVPLSATQTLSSTSSPTLTFTSDFTLEGSSRKALIVEDNLINQKILANYLKGLGWDYQIAENGLEALNASENTTFDVILMDIEMPVMNGLDASHQIRQREKRLSQAHTPIIGISANAQQEQIKAAKKVGMDDYITKPFHKVVIANLLKKLSSSDSKRENQSLSVLSIDSSLPSQNPGMAFFQPPASPQVRSKKLVSKFKAAVKELLAEPFLFRASCENDTITIQLLTSNLAPYVAQGVLAELRHLAEQILQPLLARTSAKVNCLQLVSPTPAKTLKLKAILKKAGFAEAFNSGVLSILSPQ